MQAKERFQLISQTTINEYSSEIKLYKHTKSGARILFVENDDTNKVFGVSFRTPVNDNTGVAHILEHSVLSGSDKYPLKEPFVNLVKSSLNTFLNAMTYPDRTVYPVASQNKKDLYNLANVYMDAVFFPKLLPETFKQEGWHYEIDSADEPITFKGVVYNEMKGVYSNSDGMYTDYIMNHLNPQNTYQYDSGGNPDHIPELSYEAFKKFHETYYHPSNSLVYIYGDDLSDERFDLVDAYLSRFNAVEIDSTIAPQPQLTQTLENTEYFDPGDGEDDKGYISSNWLLPEKKHTFPYAILDKILSGSPTSPLYKVIIESGLGDDIVPFFGFELDLIQPLVGYGLKGVREENQTKVYDLIHKTLSDIVQNGIDSKDIDAALNSTEFYLREYETGSYPKGLSMMLGIVVDWVYDRDFMNTLSFEKDLQRLKNDLATNPRYFEDLIQTDLLDNPHKLQFKFLPKVGLNKAIESSEEQKLEKYSLSLSKSEVENLVKETVLLREFQATKDTPQQIATLPKLVRTDLEGKPEFIPCEINEHEGVSIYTHNINTNGIVYLDIGFNLEAIDSKYYQYLPLYTRLLSELNTKTHTAGELNQELDIYTGNFGTAIVNMETLDKKIVRYLFLRGKVLEANVDKLTNIWLDILKNLVFNNKEKIQQIITDTQSSLESSIVTDGRAYGTLAINSRLTITGDFDEITSGYRYLEWLRGLLNDFDLNWENILTDLYEIQAKLFVKNSMMVNITAEKNDLQKITKKITNFISNFEIGKLNKTPIIFEQYNEKTVFIIPTKVNFICSGTKLVNPNSIEFSGAYNPIINQINYEYLWSKIRAIGGAYGSRAMFDRVNGTFNLFSYRDPRFEGTLEDYQAIPKFLNHIELEDDQLLNLVIGSIGKFDSYMSPRQKGWVSLMRSLSGRTYDELQVIRDQILNVGIHDFNEFGEMLEKANPVNIIAAFSSQSSFDKVEDGDSYTVIKPLLK